MTRQTPTRQAHKQTVNTQHTLCACTQTQPVRSQHSSGLQHTLAPTRCLGCCHTTAGAARAGRRHSSAAALGGCCCQQ